jgi:hypothetical protein
MVYGLYGAQGTKSSEVVKMWTLMALTPYLKILIVQMPMGAAALRLIRQSPNLTS